MGLISFFDSKAILLIIAVLFVSLYFLKLLFRQNGAASRGGGKLLRPPGSTGWPIIGEGLDFLKMSQAGVLEKFFSDRTQKYLSEIFSTALLGENITFLGAGGAGNKFLFSNEFKLVNSWWPPAIRKIIPNAQQASTEQESKTLRKLYSQFFKPDALHRYIVIMDLMTRRHFENSWDNKEEVTVYLLVKNYTFSVACSLFLSIDDQGRVDELHKPFSDMFDGLIALPINLPGTTQPCYQSFQRGPKGNHITGHDTTTSVITMVLKFLAEHPDVYSEVLKGTGQNNKATVYRDSDTVAKSLSNEKK
ncbi:hypothetical protein BVC80_1691g9 [Macleaya cordata]|uniref:Cytochrome P450 n=1 Tax=Macleaya cordata TaxID=56857 RepID=A0A200PPA3_MACCD|nr:hypothetical protein BVC80_1691g9 [Macleaya cordata]